MDPRRIEITDQVTRITTSTDEIGLPWWRNAPTAQSPRKPTGARVTLEFWQVTPLARNEPVNVRYSLGGDDCPREAVGVPQPIRGPAGNRQLVVHHYRLSHWIAPEVLMRTAASHVRKRTD